MNDFYGFVKVVLNEREQYIAEMEPIEGPFHILVVEKIRGKKVAGSRIAT